MELHGLLVSRLADHSLHWRLQGKTRWIAAFGLHRISSASHTGTIRAVFVLWSDGRHKCAHVRIPDDTAWRWLARRNDAVVRPRGVIVKRRATCYSETCGDRLLVCHNTRSIVSIQQHELTDVYTNDIFHTVTSSYCRSHTQYDIYHTVCSTLTQSHTQYDVYHVVCSTLNEGPITSADSQRKRREEVRNCFALLQRTSSLEHAFLLYRHVYIMLCSPHAMSTVAASLDELINALSNELPATDEQQIDVQYESDACDTVKVVNLKKSSPFSASFAEVIENTDISDNAHNAAVNRNYNPASFECIHDVVLSHRD